MLWAMFCVPSDSAGDVARVAQSAPNPEDCAALTAGTVNLKFVPPALDLPSSAFELKQRIQDLFGYLLARSRAETHSPLMVAVKARKPTASR
jgi:hypothetical protein